MNQTRWNLDVIRHICKFLQRVIFFKCIDEGLLALSSGLVQLLVLRITRLVYKVAILGNSYLSTKVQGFVSLKNRILHVKSVEILFEQFSESFIYDITISLTFVRHNCEHSCFCYCYVYCYCQFLISPETNCHYAVKCNYLFI